MTITAAQITDIPELKKLYRLLFTGMSQLQPLYYQTSDQDADFIKESISRENSEILVAREEDCLLGFALVQCLQTPPYPCIAPHRFTYLMDFVVDESQRRKGIGKALLAAVKEWAEERGSDYIELNVLTQNTPALNLYQGMRFEECTKTMRLNLDV